ncbi:Eco57I restriction-modification methylase domain-containing protein [Clostridium botulinum]|uniref:Eco57I restriction-modification methylase domain-containing protein n=1 Tax=Clostridium botulinum TaxID=1491 RepID=UPI00096FE20B|nr:Eco57I restriction-modification methylase domain-containing protein [Clostridium botulinum]
MCNLIIENRIDKFQFLDKALLEVRKSNNLSELKEQFEQFFTNSDTANFMAKMIKPTKRKRLKILDPGAGIGILTAALVINICNWKFKPKLVNAVLYELDINLNEHLRDVLEYCKHICKEYNIQFKYQIIQKDFIEQSVESIKKNTKQNFDCIIMNPPYRKINTGSKEKRMLLSVGIDCSNYYSAFVSLGKRHLKNKGQIVAITPRSFCNGAYFLEFRKDLLKDMKFQHIHLFHSRKSVFKEDEVLQENIIYNCVKDKRKKNNRILISHSSDNHFVDLQDNRVNLTEIIYPDDEEYIIHILRDEEEKQICDKMRKLPCTLRDLNIDVSTGPVVDFRIENGLLNKENVGNGVPIIFSEHISNGFINWPIKDVKKFNYIIPDKTNLSKLRLNGNYVLVKRMVSKEGKKRVVASIYMSEKFNTKLVGFDNKINYYNINKAGIDIEIARGLCIYLNSRFVDWYFRIISGSTQINATDLRNIRYPNIIELKELSRYFIDRLPEQNEIDSIVENIVLKG